MAVTGVTLAALGRALGVGPQQLNGESRREGFPIVVDTPGERRFDVEAVRAWRLANVKPNPAGRRGRPPRLGIPMPATQGDVSPELKPESAPVARSLWNEPLAKDDDPFIVSMRSGSATALDITRAAVQMLSRQMANEAVTGRVSAPTQDSFKKSLAELRAAESGYVELERSMRNLIPRAEVEGLVGACVSRLIRALGMIENAIATEVNLWVSDSAFARMAADERGRLVRAFVAKQANEVRRMEADGVQKMIDGERADEDG
jgi:hypothetical protein